MKQLIFWFLWLAFFPLYAQSNYEDLKITSNDLRLIRVVHKDNTHSFELYIRQKPGLEAVVITDSTADPSLYSASYILRAFEKLVTTPNQFTLPDGKVINNDERLAAGYEPLYLLMSNQAQSVKGFEPGSLWFRIQLPGSVMFGYPWGDREGQIDIDVGTWLNIRTFRSNLLNYRQGFKDNPFILSYKLENAPVPLPREEPFQQLAVFTGGQFYTTPMLPSIENIIAQSTSNNLDVALVIDTTISMKEHLKVLKEQLVPLLQNQILNKYPNKKVRFAVVFYRDYNSFDKYLTFHRPFTSNLDELQGYLNLKEATAFGGGDVPEAVHEGIDTALTSLEWVASEKFIIQMGDAIPLPPTNRKFVISADQIIAKARSYNTKVFPILLPDPATLKRQGLNIPDPFR